MVVLVVVRVWCVVVMVVVTVPLPSSLTQFLSPQTEEMGSFAKQWVEPLFQISPLSMLVVLHLALLVGLIAAVPSFSLIVGLAVGGGIFVLLTFFLFILSHSSRR